MSLWPERPRWDWYESFQELLRRNLLARGARSTRVHLAGQDVHFYDVAGRGKGPTLLLVHGLGSSASAFSRVMFPLAKRFRRVLALDLPGSGFSPTPESGPLALEQHIDVLKAFVAQVAQEPVFLVGNSLGGALSLALTLRAPERIAALALVAPAGAQLSEIRLESLLETLRVETTAQAREVTRRLFHRPSWLALAFAPAMLRQYAAPSVRAVLAEARKMAGVLSPEALAQLTVPTLLIWGQSEKLLPFESVDYFRAHLPPVARVEVVKGFGHVPQMEHPRALVARLVSFADERKL